MFTRSKHTLVKTTSILAATTAVLAVTLAFVARPDRLPRGYDIETVDVPFGVPGQDLVMEIVWMNTPGAIVVQYQSPPAADFLENVHTAVLERGEWRIIDVPGAVTTGATN